MVKWSNQNKLNFNKMAKVEILQTGYSSTESNGRSSPTISLVVDENKKIIVDPGVVKDQKVIVDALKKHNLAISDVDFVFVTHWHPDHARNVGMFEKAVVIDWWGWWENDLFKDFSGKLTKDIKIIKTPGHSYDGTSMLVKTDRGTVAICGDVFWQEDYPEKDPYAQDLKALQKSRQKVLKLADFIIPGHGAMFKSV